MSSEPPLWIIEAARVVGAWSPCVKSKRGVVIFNREQADRLLEGRTDWEQANTDGWNRFSVERSTILSRAHNAPPTEFPCTGTGACRANCGKLCNHAEERAIRSASVWSDLDGFELVHVKVVDGKVVPGGKAGTSDVGGPSCWQCSRLIADTKLSGVWLYERDISCPSDTCWLCTGQACNQCPSPSDAGHPRNRCEHDVLERHKGIVQADGVWKFYTRNQFHEATLSACEIRR